MHEASTPDPSAQSSQNAESKKRSRNHEARRAPDHEQELTGILKLIKPELTDRRGWMALRYALLYRGVGGRFNGLAAEVRLAAVRILDALRLLNPDYFPDYLRELDVLSDEQLKGAYPADHDIWKLDLCCFAGIDWATLDLPELGKLIARCIKSNFKCVKCYVKNGDLILRSENPFLISLRYPEEYMERAVQSLQAHSHLALPSIPVPGWGYRCQRNWRDDASVQLETDQRRGLAYRSYESLVQVDSSLMAKTCVKGGRRVKI